MEKGDKCFNSLKRSKVKKVFKVGISVWNFQQKFGSNS